MCCSHRSYTICYREPLQAPSWIVGAFIHAPGSSVSAWDFYGRCSGIFQQQKLMWEGFSESGKSDNNFHYKIAKANQACSYKDWEVKLLTLFCCCHCHFLWWSYYYITDLFGYYWVIIAIMEKKKLKYLSLKIVVLNLIKRMIKLIKKEKIDILCLQSMTLERLKINIWAQYVKVSFFMPQLKHAKRIFFPILLEQNG